MATLYQLRTGLSEAWDSLLDGWQRLYRRAADAITRFTPGKRKSDEDAARELSIRNSGWGVLAAEVYDGDAEVVVRIEAPGLDKSDFDLQVVDGHLIVRGEKRLERERTEGRYHITECAYGAFERAIPLPVEVQADAAKARYRHGVLRVELPKVAHAQRRRLSIAVK